MFDLFIKWAQKNQKRLLEDFFTFLSFSSISTDPAYQSDIFKCANWLKDYLTKMGLRVEMWENPQGKDKPPILFAEHVPTSFDQTVLIYHHYDVQPVDPLELWETPPFEPHLKGDHIVARGASDNKGQCFFTLMFLQAMKELMPDMPVHIKLLIEGEEECGSQGLTELAPLKKNALRSDGVLVIDFDLPSANVPGITLGVRGCMHMEVTCSTGDSDLHSGAHGGLACSATRALTDLLSKLWKPTGEIAIPEFYAEGDGGFDWLNKKVTHVALSPEAYKQEFGVSALAPGWKGQQTYETFWMQPAIEITGLWGGYTGEGNKTVLPCKAFAKISLRLIPGQSPDKAAEWVENFLQKHHLPGVEIFVKREQGSPAFWVSEPSWLIDQLSEAYSSVFAKPCLFSLTGGSVPITSVLARVTEGAIGMIGTALMTDRIHAPNEHFSIRRMEQGFALLTKFFYDLSNRR